ncbi:MAG: hypothetical protein AB1791_07760 [Chloroflexota bacterium]
MLRVVPLSEAQEQFAAEFRRQSIDRLFETIEGLHALDLPPMTEDEIKAEIAAARAERRNAHVLIQVD